jgi:TIR domain
MRVFLSYATEQLPLAEQVWRALEGDGYSVFFDRSRLHAGDDYHSRIRNAVRRSHAFVMLVTPDAIAEGSYALTELRIAGELPPRRRPVVIPVMVQPVEYERLPSGMSEVTVLEPHGDVPAEIAAALDSRRRGLRRRNLLRLGAWAIVLAVAGAVGPTIYRSFVPGSESVPAAERVKLRGFAANGGWMITFDIADTRLREIVYALDGGGEFKSTGLSDYRDPQTGLPVPNYAVLLPGVSREHDFLVKYTDGRGVEQGPFKVHFDPRASYVAESKRQLAMMPWVSFLEMSRGEPFAYFALLVYKNAFDQVRYSVDDESLSQRIRFTPDWNAVGVPPITADDQTLVAIPPTARFVAVQLRFIDGSSSEIRRFPRTDTGS